MRRIGFTLKNIGPIESSSFKLGDLTILCGKNNTGKTYVTYSLFGLLKHLRSSLSENCVAPEELLSKKRFEVVYDEKRIRDAIAKQCRSYSKDIAAVFAGEDDHFLNAQVVITDFDYGFTAAFPVDKIEFGKDDDTFKYVLKYEPIEGGKALRVTVDQVEGGLNAESAFILSRILSERIGARIVSAILPRVFVSSAERTGAAIFQKELDFTRNRLVEVLGNKKASKITPSVLLDSFRGEYPLAVRANVDFIRELPSLTGKKGEIFKSDHEMATSLNDLMGGTYHATKDGTVRYQPKNNKKAKLQLGECSSSVRALLDIDFYIRHLAKPGDLFMIDEPEMNLHPSRQRLLARILARLVNHGVQVLITTHSDFLIREFSILMMLQNDTEKCCRIAREEGYASKELLASDKIKVYVANKKETKRSSKNVRVYSTDFSEVAISQCKGISIESFDTTIDEMNAIQDRILWE